MRGNNFKKFSIAGLVWLEFGLGEKTKNIFEQTSFQSGCYLLPNGI
jgi:hypothetical protein